MTTKTFEEIVADVLEEHKELFEALAPYDTLEYEIGEWIVNNKEGLQDKLNNLNKKHTRFFPDSLYSIYLDQYKDHAIKVIRTQVAEALKLDAENALRIDEKCIKLVAEDLLRPKEVK